MIPEEMRKCVVFIGMHVKDGHQSVLKFGGTGFLVSAPAESDPSIDITYLVTAKHVANAVNGQMFFMRLNTKDGMSSLFAGLPDLTWWFHPSDPTADVAVIPMDTPPVDLDYRVIPTRRFVTT